jgi:phage-related minor tail protein
VETAFAMDCTVVNGILAVDGAVAAGVVAVDSAVAPKDSSALCRRGVSMITDQFNDN